MASLPQKALRLDRGLVLRRRDLLDLYDTTPDLMGNDVDVSRFIRDATELDVLVCWRDFADQPENPGPPPEREELCTVPIGDARRWVDTQGNDALWTWDVLRGRWIPTEKLQPGQALLRRSKDGGYEPAVGLEPGSPVFVSPIPLQSPPHIHERENDDDPLVEWPFWYTLASHSDDVAGEAHLLADLLGLPAHFAAALVSAGRWHDAGKAHAVFQTAAKALGSDPPPDAVAKSRRQNGRIVYGRTGFRHELASALLALQHGLPDLVCFLIACHHGKVRLSLRALPTEDPPTNHDGRPDPTIRHARGIWEGDLLPAVDLGAGVTTGESRLTLRYMELGDDELTGPSWLSRMLALRDDCSFGPFRMALLEGLIKCADERSSRRVSSQGGAA